MTTYGLDKKARAATSSRVNVRVLAVMSALVMLGGCGADDVQLNGKIFDAVGLSGNASKSEEPKLAQRAPLVLPPTLDRVPEPGKPADAQAAQANLAAIQDPDKKQKATRAELEAQQAAYCKVHYEDAKVRGDDTADLAEGPLGPCRGSMISAITKWNKGDDDADDSSN